MIEKALFNCTVSMLMILLKQYEAGLISYCNLCTNTKIKADFLEKHLSDADDPEKRTLAQNLLKNLESIHFSNNHGKK